MPGSNRGALLLIAEARRVRKTRVHCEASATPYGATRLLACDAFCATYPRLIADSDHSDSKFALDDDEARNAHARLL